MKQLMDEYRLTQEELAERIGKSRPAVTNTLRSALAHARGHLDGRLRQVERRARARRSSPFPKTCSTSSPATPSKTAISVRDIERSVRDYFGLPEELRRQKERSRSKQVSIELKDLIERMRHTFKTKVSLIGNDKKGRIYIGLYNTDDLNRISEIVDLVDRSELR